MYLSVDAHGTITELKHERFKSTKNDEVLLNKLYLNGRSAYVVSFENITKGFLEFDKAQSFYSRNENKLLNLKIHPIPLLLLEYFFLEYLVPKYL